MIICKIIGKSSAESASMINGSPEQVLCSLILLFVTGLAHCDTNKEELFENMSGIYDKMKKSLEQDFHEEEKEGYKIDSKKLNELLQFLALRCQQN